MGGRHPAGPWGRRGLTVGSGAAARLGWLVAWLGAVLVGGIGILATVHLASDVVRVIARARGVESIAWLGAAAVLVVGAGALAVGVARLADRGPRGERLAVLVGFMFLVGIRFAVAVAYDGVADGELHAYDLLAKRVLEGDCCWSDRPMGYPVALAGAYAILGPSSLAVEVLNLCLAAATGVTVLLAARHLFGPVAGAVALLAYALWPAGALMIATSLPHTAYELVVAGSALATVATRPGWRGSAAIGVLLALGQYLRPSTPALLLAFLFARAWPLGPWRRIASGTVVPMVVAFGLLLIPVAEHELRIHGEIGISTSSFGGHSLYVGTDLRSGGTLDEVNRAEIEALPGASVRDKSRAAGLLALERIREDPLAIALLAVRKQDTLWGTERYGVQYAIGRELAERPERPAGTLPGMASGAFWAVLAFATAAGLYLGRHDPDRLALLLVAVLVAVSLSHALLEVRDRYHSYVVPLMLPIAARAAVEVWRRVARRAGGDDRRPLAPGPPAGSEGRLAP